MSSDSEQGLERLRAVAQSNPRSTAFVALAHALCDNGRDEEAEEVCRQGLLQHPRLVTGQVALGRALIGRGRWAEAKEVLVMAAKGNPEHGDAFRWLGDLVLHEGDSERARILLEYAEELMPNDGRIADLLVMAGGKAALHAARPSTDFEHTQVKDARALAERMHEDPPSARNGGRGSPDDDRTPVVLPLAQPDSATPTVETFDVALPAAIPPRPTRPAVALRALLLAAVAGTVIALVIVVVRQRPPEPVPVVRAPGPAAASAPAEGPKADLAPLRQAIFEGSLEGLQKVRAAGKPAGQGGPADPDLAATVAFADALLAADWGVSLGTEVNQAADLAARGQPAVAARTAAFESARAIAAAAHGHLAEARAAAERALAASASGYESRFAAGRIKLLLGDLGPARIDLESALAAAPGFILAAFDQASALIDAGDPGSSAAKLEELLADRPDELRARLLLAEARRASARSGDNAQVRQACRDPGPAAIPLRVLCAAAAATEARLAGDRAGALRLARAAMASGPIGPSSARGAAQAALTLANLGEIDAASEALGRIRDHVGAGFAPRLWAEAAVALGRGEKLSTVITSTPPGPEARLSAARVAFSQGGAAALSATLGRFGTAAVEFDPDLKTFSVLANEGRLSPKLRLELERRAIRGNPLAAYVVGRSALAAGDGRTAARRLQSALKGPLGDACEAARLILTIDFKYRPYPVATEARIARLLKARNATCIHVRRGGS